MSVQERRPGLIKYVVATVALALMMAILPGDSSAYTVEKRDEPVTEQFVISPTKVELTLQPGQSAVRQITIVNRTGKIVMSSFSVEDFEGSRDPAESHRLMGIDDSSWGARLWMKPELEAIELEHGETLTFDVRIQVPLDAEPGGHYAAVLALAEEQDVQEGGVQLKGRVTALFLITVPGDIDSRGNLNDPEVPLLSSYGPTTIGLVFNNLGNVHQSPAGTVTITNILGQQVAEIPVKEWVVLPESARRTQIEWPGKWHLGPYKVTARISYGDNGETLYTTSTMWFIPWQLILAALAISIIITGLYLLITRNRRRNKQAIQDELDELRALNLEQEEEYWQEDEAMEADDEATADTDADAATRTAQLVPLNELLPSTEDTKLVDISDPETRQLIRELINNEMDLARMYIMESKHEEARRELEEAKAAALRIGLLAEVATIDGLLSYL